MNEDTVMNAFDYETILYPGGTALIFQCNVPKPDSPNCLIEQEDGFEVTAIYEPSTPGSELAFHAKVPQEVIEEWRHLKARIGAINQYLSDCVVPFNEL